MIDDKTVQRARNADMVTFLELHLGFTFVCCHDSYRCREHPSLAIKQDHMSWFWHSHGKGGCGTLDWLIQIENMPFRTAVETVLNIQLAAAPLKKEELPGLLVLPEKRSVPSKLYHYLCNRRCIHRGIVETLIQEEKLYEDLHGNVVFVGHNETGDARFASLRGTYGDCRYRKDCLHSNKKYGFHMDAVRMTSHVYLFESPIDAMSHGSLANAHTHNPGAWQMDFRLSLAGTSDLSLPFFLNQHPDIHELVLCLDSDPVGRTAASRIAEKYSAMGYVTRLELPLHKDYNNDLQFLSSIM